MELNYKALNERLCLMDARAALVEYIFRVQGAELRRLDFDTAAKSIGVSERSISRYVGELADRKILIIINNQLKLNKDILTAG